MALGPGTHVGNRYLIQFKVGQGKAGGAVYGAKDTEDPAGRRVAVKYPLRRGELEVLTAIRDKAGGIEGQPRSLQCMPHLLGWGEHQRAPYVATALLGNPVSLVFRRLKGPQETNWYALCALGRMVVRRLQVVHRCGYAHCDIQPANILMGQPATAPAVGDGAGAPREWPYLIDFGAAKPFPCGGPVRADYGSVDFNSIHSAEGGERGPYDDLESLGWVLCHGLFGDLPWFPYTSQATWTQGKLSEKDRPVVCGQVRDAKAALVRCEVSSFGPLWAHLADMPQGLARFLRICGERGGDSIALPDYDELVDALNGGGAGTLESKEQRDAAQFQECLALAEAGKELSHSHRRLWTPVAPQQAPFSVKVTVRHAQLEDNSITVEVLNTSKAIDVRRAVIGELGEKRLSGVKLVRKKGKGDCAVFMAWDDNEKIGDTREFVSVGRSLARAVPAPVSEEVADGDQELPEPFTRERALRLQRGMIDGFISEDFQTKLKALHEAHPDRQSAAYRKEKQLLCLTVQSAVLPEYGFPGTIEGVFRMVVAFYPHVQDPEVRRNSAEIDWLLGIDSSTIPTRGHS